MHPEILSNEQKDILAKLAFTKGLELYLAGGTALALQIGHRTSIDFDFYTAKQFKAGQLVNIFKENLSQYLLKVLRDTDDTFEIQINDVHLSCFYYPYPLLEKLVDFQEIRIASCQDIAAMKILAISQRGKRRDYIDIYYLIQKIGLNTILSLTQQKFKTFDIYHGLRGLVYFIDADKDEEVKRVEVFDRVSWPQIKKYISNQIKLYNKR